MKKWLIALLAISVLVFSGCGGSSSSDSTNLDELTDTSKAIESLQLDIPNKDLPVNEDITLNDNVKVLSQDEIEAVDIVDNGDGTHTINYNTSATSRSFNRNLRAWDGLKVGDYILAAFSAPSNPFGIGWKIIKITASGAIQAKVIDNVCEIVSDGTITNNGNYYGLNHIADFKNFAGSETFGESLTHKLTYSVTPAVAVQCFNSEPSYIHTALSGDIVWEVSLGDLTEKYTKELSPISLLPAATPVNLKVGKAQIGLSVEFTPSFSVQQNIYKSPTLTFKNKFHFSKFYDNGKWEETKQDVGVEKPIFKGVDNDPETPTVELEMNGKFYVGIGADSGYEYTADTNNSNTIKLKATTGLYANLTPSISFKKDKEADCASLRSDLDANAGVSFDSLFGSHDYSPEMMKWNIYKDYELAKIFCTVKNVAPTAKISAAPTTIKVGDTVHFDATGSSDDTGIKSYEWKNGSTTISTASTFAKSDFSAGTHTITLIVTDNDGATDSKSVNVIVSETTPTIGGSYSGTKTYTNNAKYNIKVDFDKKEYCVEYYGWQCSNITIAKTSTFGVEFYTYPKSNSTCKHTFSGNFDDGKLTGTFTNPSCADSNYGTFSVLEEKSSSTAITASAFAKPTHSQCTSGGGIWNSSSNECSGSWDNGNNICSNRGGIPSIEQWVNLFNSCGANADISEISQSGIETKMGNCMNNKGFVTIHSIEGSSANGNYTYYWSSLKNNLTSPWNVGYTGGGYWYVNSSMSNSATFWVRCVR